MVAETVDPKIKALAPWFGGKRTLGATIAAEFGPHRAYWGLCCGSLAVEFAKEPATMEACIDMHGDLTNLAFVLQDETLAVELYSRLTRTLLSREIFLESAKVIREIPAPAGDAVRDVDRAYHYMIVSWFGRNGVSGTSSYNAGFCMRYTKNGGHAATRFTSAVDSIPPWHHRIRAMTIVRDDILLHLPRIEDADGVVIYIDPPYLVKGAKYLHDADDSLLIVRQILGITSTNIPKFAWHMALARLVNRFQKTRVVVSYYDHELLAELYPGWTIRRLKASKSLVNQGMRDTGGSVEAPEVLLINGPSLVVKSSGDLF